MSVVESMRTESKAQYVTNSITIFTKTANFVSRLTKPYFEMFGRDLLKLASEFMELCEKANSIYPSDDQKRALRREYLIQARCDIYSYDVYLTRCLIAFRKNPCRCFQKPSGKTLDSQKAKERIYRCSQSLGEFVNDEKAILTKLIEENK